jgi:hypothetical protein
MFQFHKCRLIPEKKFANICPIFWKNSEPGVITEFCLFQISNSVPYVVYKTRPCLLACLFLYYFRFQHEFSETEGFRSQIWNTALQVAKIVSPGSGM